MTLLTDSSSTLFLPTMFACYHLLKHACAKWNINGSWTHLEILCNYLKFLFIAVNLYDSMILFISVNSECSVETFKLQSRGRVIMKYERNGISRKRTSLQVLLSERNNLYHYFRNWIIKSALHTSQKTCREHSSSFMRQERNT